MKPSKLKMKVLGRTMTATQPPAYANLLLRRGIE
jgi:hypothetical protein